MGIRVFVSSMSHRRIARARAWLEGREPAEGVLIVGASLDAANELARAVAQMKGAAFGWHRLSLSQLAAALAGPMLATRMFPSVGWARKQWRLVWCMRLLPTARSADMRA